VVRGNDALTLRRARWRDNGAAIWRHAGPEGENINREKGATSFPGQIFRTASEDVR
jgi:hypothetical protein